MDIPFLDKKTMTEQVCSLAIDQQEVFDMLPINAETRAKLYAALLKERSGVSAPRGILVTEVVVAAPDQNSQQKESESLGTNSENCAEPDLLQTEK